MKAFVIGRSKECDVVIVDPTVSRRHAEFVVKSDSEFMLTDCGSSFGTFIGRDGDWTQIGTATVRIGDHVRLGRHETTVRTIMTVVLDKLRQDAALKAAEEPAAQPPPRQPERKPVIERDPETGEIIMRK